MLTTYYDAFIKRVLTFRKLRDTLALFLHCSFAISTARADRCLHIWTQITSLNLPMESFPCVFYIVKSVSYNLIKQPFGFFVKQPFVHEHFLIGLGITWVLNIPIRNSNNIWVKVKSGERAGQGVSQNLEMKQASKSFLRVVMDYGHFCCVSCGSVSLEEERFYITFISSNDGKNLLNMFTYRCGFTVTVFPRSS